MATKMHLKCLHHFAISNIILRNEFSKKNTRTVHVMDIVCTIFILYNIDLLRDHNTAVFVGLREFDIIFF